MHWASRSAIVTALVLGGCGDGTSAPVDAAVVDSAPILPGCVADQTCTWLTDFQQEVVGKLSGDREIAPGVTLAHRASIAERDIARAYLVDAFAAVGVPATLHTYGTGANVIAVLDATVAEPGGLLVVGAHFDGVAAGPGAADDATGVALVLSAARRLNTVTPRHHAIAFALFDQEEIGLIGSKAYAASLVADSVVVEAMHTFDMLSFDGDGDRAIELWSPSEGLAEQYQAQGLRYGIPIGPVVFEFSDHQSFLDEGMPAVGVGEEFAANDHTPHYHTATDTYDKIDFEYLGDATQLVFDVLAADLAQ